MNSMIATTVKIPVIVTMFETPWNFTIIPINAHNITNVYARFFLINAKIASPVAMTIIMADHTSGAIPHPLQFAT